MENKDFEVVGSLVICGKLLNFMQWFLFKILTASLDF